MSNLYAEHMERTMLGAMILEPQALHAGLATLDGQELYLDSHRKVFTALVALGEARAGVDIQTLIQEVKRRKWLDSVGGMSFLMELTEGIPRNFCVEPYVKVIKEKAALRSIISLANVAIARAEEAESSESILGDLYSGALAYQAQTSELRPVPIAELVGPAWDEIAEQMEVTTEVLGIPTGIAELDRRMTGWRNGEYTLVGAKPGMGKTSFMLQCIQHAARAGFPVGCISLEMRANQLLRRLAVMGSGIHAGKWKDPRAIPQAERGYAKHAMLSLAELPVWITDQAGLNPRQIVTLSRKMHAEGAKAIFIDFIQIIKEVERDQRVAINKVSAAIRDCCKELNIPFIVLSQLSRGDKDSNRKPTKEDFRESGNLEQDIHNALLMWREKDGEGAWTGEDLIIIDKAREGATGKIDVRYDSATLTYKSR